MLKGAVARGLLLAAGSGTLYGTITVMAKAVDAYPLAKATLSSLAAAVVMAPFLRGVRISRREWLRVLAMAFFGGALAPALILFGLEHANASDAGMLLTLELVATAAFAFIFLHERVSGRAATGLACLLAAAVAVALAGYGATGEHRTTWVGIVLVGLAAVAWGIDNAVSTSLVDGRLKPPQLIAVKSCIGTAIVAAAWGVMAMVQEAPGPAAPVDWLSLGLIGTIGVGGSSVLFYHALGHIGAARTSAVNVPTSALAAAVGGIAFLGEQFGWLHGAALGLILAGMVFLWERTDKRGRTSQER